MAVRAPLGSHPARPAAPALKKDNLQRKGSVGKKRRGPP